MVRSLAFVTGVLVLMGAALKDGPAGKVGDFTLDDPDGVKHSLSDYRDSKAIVLMFVGTQCPTSNAYSGRLNELYADYGPRHVTFIAINSNDSEDLADMKKSAAEKGFRFPMLKDQGNVVADKLGATVTPEIYLLNPGFEVLYHGRIDDSGREARVTSKDLRNALEEMLSGKAVSVPSTKAFGCTIKRAG